MLRIGHTICTQTLQKERVRIGFVVSDSQSFIGPDVNVPDDMVEPRADRIATHRQCVVGLQDLRDNIDIHPRIEPPKS
jgi:hypothetical protein